MSGEFCDAATPDDLAFIQYSSGSTSDPQGRLPDPPQPVHQCPGRLPRRNRLDHEDDHQL